MRKFYLLLLFSIFVTVAQGQNPVNAPCNDLKYPVNGVSNKPPVPPSSWHTPQSAVVGADLTIDRRGSVKNAIIVISGGKEADDAVLKAVRNWTYSPAMCGFTAVEMTIHIKINLGLGKRS